MAAKRIIIGDSEISVPDKLLSMGIFPMIGIAVVATFLRLYDFPMPPLILAFVLGGLMEENLRRSLLLSNGSWEFLWDRTLTLCILLTTVFIVIWHIYKTFKKKN